MRAAKAADWRRRLVTKEAQWTTRLVRFALDGVPGLGTAEFSFASPLTVFSGPNGTGKSTLLRALWATLDPQAALLNVQADRKLKSGTATVDVRTPEGDVTAEVQFTDSEVRSVTTVSLAVAYVDSAAETMEYQKGFNQFESAEELTNGYAGRELKEAELAEVNFIMNRDYRLIRLYEVELGNEVPFFEVAYGDDRYDSRTMGTGEIAALHLWWRLNRLESGGIVLIEEPEAFLSYACQVALAKFLAQVFVQKRLCAVVSTHSAPLIGFFPMQCASFLSRGRGGLKSAGENPHPILLRSVGIDPPVSSVLFVEDHAAKAFCLALLQRYNPTIARQVAVDVRGGESEISNALKVTMGFAVPIKFLGLYDGDFKGRIPRELGSISTFLPGDKAIEVTFRDMIVGNPDPFIQATGATSLPLVLDRLEGADCHDWYEEVAKEISLTKEQLFPTLFNLWLRDADNEESALATYRGILGLIDPGAADLVLDDGE